MFDYDPNQESDNELRIKSEPESEEGTEPKQESEYEYREEEESEDSPQREVVPRKTRLTRNQRRARMVKRKCHQAQKSVHERIDDTHVKMRLGKGAKKDARKRPPSHPINQLDFKRRCPKQTPNGQPKVHLHEGT